jgi:hypothetical protein
VSSGRISVILAKVLRRERKHEAERICTCDEIDLLLGMLRGSQLPQSNCTHSQIQLLRLRWPTFRRMYAITSQNTLTVFDHLDERRRARLRQLNKQFRGLCEQPNRLARQTRGLIRVGYPHHPLIQSLLLVDFASLPRLILLVCCTRSSSSYARDTQTGATRRKIWSKR